MKTPVLIIGTLPQTAGIGGVTIHIERLLASLKQNNFTVDLCNYKELPYWKQIKPILQHKIIHIHVSNPILRIFYVLLASIFFKKSILTIHGNIGRFGILKNYLDRLAIKFCTIPILINQHSYEIGLTLNKQAKFISAFLPPIENGELPPSIEQIIKNERVGKIITFATNASCRKLNHLGQEVYGIDFLIDYFNHHPQYNLLISDSSGEYSSYYLKHNITLNKNIILISQPHSFLKVLEHSDIMIRNTQTDGDALSIKEAFYLNKNVFASNCVDRPLGVYLFEYNNEKEFDNLILQANQIIKKKPTFQNEDVINQIISIYNNLL